MFSGKFSFEITFPSFHVVSKKFNSRMEDQNFRDVVRSKILQRIYEKNPNGSSENNSKKSLNEKPSSDKEKEEEKALNLQIQQQLSNEWRKTLEMVLSHVDDDHHNSVDLDLTRFQVNRLESIRFFAQTDWKTDEDDEKVSSKKINRKNKRRTKNAKNHKSYRSQIIPNSVDWKLIETKRKILFTTMMAHHPININQLLAKDFDLTDNSIDSLENLQKLLRVFTVRQLSRLMREDFDLNDLSKFFFIKHSISLMKFQQRSRWHCIDESNQDLILRSSQIEQSLSYKLLNSALNFFELDDEIKLTKPQQQKLNNNHSSFILSIGAVRLDFSKHPEMSGLNRIVKRLTFAFDRYKKSIDEKSDATIEKIEKQIHLVCHKLESNNQNETNDELDMDLNLLVRLEEKRKNLIDERRQALINLLQQWEKFQNSIDRKTPKLIQEIDLNLEEIENIHQEEEQESLDKIQHQRTKIKNLIKSNSKSLPYSKLELLEDASNFLNDGRFPGEPKFKPISLIIPAKLQNQSDFFFSTWYFIEIYINKKLVATFDQRRLNQSFIVSWNNFRSFPIPVQRNSIYQPLFNENDDDELDQKFPLFRIYEKSSKNSTFTSSLLIGETSLSAMPSIKVDSFQNSLFIEKPFSDFVSSIDKKKKNSKTLTGKLVFSMFWSSLPSPQQQQNLTSEWLSAYDEDKVKILKLNNLDEINQWLHDIRYSMIQDQSSPLENNQQQIELMQLLIKQKYQLELNQFYDEKKKNCRSNLVSSYESLTENEAKAKVLSLEEREQGLFCSDSDIEINQRFQLIINRSKGLSCQFRFVPLTMTDVLLLSSSANAAEKSAIISENLLTSMNILIEYLKQTSQRQAKRIEKFDDQKVLVDQAWFPASNQARLNLATRMMHRIWTNQFNVRHIDNDDLSTGYRKITSIDEIVKEPETEAPNTGFSLFSFLPTLLNSLSSRRKLNPSRRDRQKLAININEAKNREVQIVLVVQQALNIPLLIKGNENSRNSDADSLEPDFLSPNLTFLEIKINGQPSVYTTLTNGTDPNWNESFKFKVKFDPGHNIYLNLFTVEEKKTTGRFSPEPDSDHQSIDQENFSINNGSTKTKKVWLGQLRIPLHLFLFVPKIQALSIPMESPYFLPTHRSLYKSNHLHLFDSNRKRQTTSDQNSEPEVESKLAINIKKVLELHSNNFGSGDGSITLLGSLPQISLSLFATIDPVINCKLVSNENHQSLENSDIMTHCRRWLANLQTKFPERRFHVCLPMNAEHYSVLATRFLTPLKPPSFDDLSNSDVSFTDNQKTARKSRLKNLVHKQNLYVSLIIRFVSLIPSLFETTATSKIQIDFDLAEQWLHQNVWLDCVQFLSLGIGGQAEHAVLLCCFLLYLDQNVCLAIGSGLSDGPTVYVLLFPDTRSNEDESAKCGNSSILIIDPKRGRQFSIEDYSNSLLRLDCIVTPENVFANIQRQTTPAQMNFNLKKRSDWCPLFTTRDLDRFSNLNQSIQPLSIDFGTIDQNRTKKLEADLEQHLREQFMSWRRQLNDIGASYTPLNRYCTQLVKQKVLPTLERHASLVGHYHYAAQLNQIEMELLEELDKIFKVHEMIGYPVNVSNYNLEHLTQMVHSFGLHNCGTMTFDRNQSEYVIAVYVHPYPANLKSVWIYVAMLMPK